MAKRTERATLPRVLVVVGVILGGLVLAAVLGAMREKQPGKDERPSLWGTPRQAAILIFALIMLAAVVLWLIDSNADAKF